MINIKPAEISEILKQQLEGFKSEAELEEVGTVLQVGDGIARIYGLSNVESNEMIEFESGIKGIILNLEEDNRCGFTWPFGRSKRRRYGKTTSANCFH
jgi:F-type H+-transporting ATPase subunit alpha